MPTSQSLCGLTLSVANFTKVQKKKFNDFKVNSAHRQYQITFCFLARICHHREGNFINCVNRRAGCDNGEKGSVCTNIEERSTIPNTFKD